MEPHGAGLFAPAVTMPFYGEIENLSLYSVALRPHEIDDHFASS